MEHVSGSYSLPPSTIQGLVNVTFPLPIVIMQVYQTAFARWFLVQSLVRSNIHSFPSFSFGIASYGGTLDPLIVGTAGSNDGHGPIAM